MWLNDILIPVAIYRCTVLNTFLKVAKFLNARTERQINAFNMSVTHPEKTLGVWLTASRLPSA
ncbi:MAG: hypothetical protein SPK91_08255 [Bacteroidales bacterium]|nr:hypothetical protein [Bacteroidales bacterium]